MEPGHAASILARSSISDQAVGWIEATSGTDECCDPREKDREGLGNLDLSVPLYIFNIALP